MKTVDKPRDGGHRGPHVPPVQRDHDMRVSKYRGDWKRRVFRVMPEQRAAVVEIAQALGVTADGVARLSLRAYAAKRGHDLPGWQPVETVRVLAFDAADARDLPRTWLHFRESWLPVVEALYLGECRTFAGVLREAITEFHAAGAETWQAAMITPPADQPASTAPGADAR
mgnify:CR=1 FL=1